MSIKETRWRLLLGAESENPSASSESLHILQPGSADSEIDEVLEQLYDKGKRSGGLGDSNLSINKWVSKIRLHFSKSVVKIIQKDALNILGVKQMLLEPETLESLESDVNLVSQLIALKDIMPEKTLRTARTVVEKIVYDIQKKLKWKLQKAVQGSLNKGNPKTNHLKPNDIHWQKTILKNLKNFNPKLNAIIPEKIFGFGKKTNKMNELVLLVDQSGSMGNSLVFSSITAAALASLPSLKTHLISFDAQAVDLTPYINDPVSLLFAAQLSGGTDIGNALAFAHSKIQNPKKTTLILISDLFEGGDEKEMYKYFALLKHLQVNVIILPALDDKGIPAFDHSVAKILAQMVIPVFACTPDHLPDLLAITLSNKNLFEISDWGVGIQRKN